jgi:hypothetical protein
MLSHLFAYAREHQLFDLKTMGEIPHVFRNVTLTGLSGQRIYDELQKDKTTYNCTLARDTTVLDSKKHTFHKVTTSTDLYLQWGLQDEQDNGDAHPIAQAISTIKHTSDTEQIFWSVFRQHEVIMDQVIKEVSFFPHTPDLVLNTIPIWFNGNFKAVTKTHFDDYLNFVIVLKGSKTFYLLAPGEMVRTDEDVKRDGYELNEAPYINLATHPNRKEFKIVPGDMLIIPPRWWHAVHTEPNTLMLNFWYNPNH